MDDDSRARWSMADLTALRERHPTWRLLCASNAAFVISFLHRTFIIEQRRQVPVGDMLDRLEDHLFAARAQEGDRAFPRTAAGYLDDWAGDSCCWIRRSYPSGQDVPVYDLTPAAERAIEVLAGMRNRSFIGTESRLLTVIDLLRQIRDGSETDPEARIRELEQRRAAIDADIERIRDGILPVMGDVAVRDRFQLATDTARALLSDLREVEQNFRHLDRETRTSIATWDGGKGPLLAEILARREAIAESDQGRSFRAFWDFLMAPRRQQEFDVLMAAALALPAIRQAAPDPRFARIRDDWLGAGEHAQRTVARLSEQLRRFLDDQAALENRRINLIIHGIEQRAAILREQARDIPPMAMDGIAPEVLLPMDRRLFTPPLPVRFPAEAAGIGVSEADADVLFDQVYIDPELLTANIRRCLADADEVALPQVLERHPLADGLAELVGYMRLACGDATAVRAAFDDRERDLVGWTDGNGRQRRASIPRIVFTR